MVFFFSFLPLQSYKQPVFELSLMVLSRWKQITLSSSGKEKNNMLVEATRSLQDTVAQSRMSNSIRAMQFM